MIEVTWNIFKKIRKITEEVMLTGKTDGLKNNNRDGE